MDFDLDFVNPEEEEKSLAENKEGVNQPQSGEKLNKCNQCNFASSYASDLRKHMKNTLADVLRTHLKTHSGE